MDLYVLVIVLLACSALAGWVAAWVYTWTMRRFLLDLDYRLTDLEGRLTREVKLRAAGESVKARQSDRELDEWALKQRQAPGPAGGGVSVAPFNEWYRDKMRAKP